MERFGKKSSQGLTRAKISSQLALPDWLNGKRLPTIAEVETYLACHPQRTPDVDKRILKTLMEVVVEQARHDSSQRALIIKTERDVQNSSSQEAIYRAEIERLTKEIEESQRYRIKLLKKIEPLEQRLRSVELEEEDQDVMSSSERTIPVSGPQAVQAASLKADQTKGKRYQSTMQAVDGKLLQIPQLSEHLVPIFEQNYILGELSQMYRDKLDILKSSFYDKEVLEHALQRFIQSDCIEYKDYGIEAYEILSLHERLLDITHSEKLLAFQIQSRESMQLLPQLTTQNIKLTGELQNLKQIYERQRKILQSQGILTHDDLSTPHVPPQEDEFETSYFMTKWRKEKEKMYCDQATRIKQKHGPGNRSLPESMKQSYAYTQKALNTPEFAIKLDAYTQPGDAVIAQKSQAKQRPGERKQGLVEYLEPIGESPRRDQDFGIQDSSSRSKPTTQQSKGSKGSPASKGSSKETGQSQKKTEEASYVGKSETESQQDGASTGSRQDSAGSQKSGRLKQSPHALARALIAEATSGYFEFKKEAKKQPTEIEA